MFRTRLVGLLLGASVAATSASAQGQSQPNHELTFDQALALARRHAPDLETARARIGEARARVKAASVWPHNPQIEAAAGPRLGGTETTADWSLGVRQWIDLGGQRGDRLDAATAGADAAKARTQDAKRLVLREVGLAFVQAVYWKRRVDLAEDNRRVAEAIAHAATRRHQVGDVGGLEESVASLSLVRAQTDESRSHAALGQAEARLRILLGLDASARIVPRGDLRQVAAYGDVPESLDVAARPDLAALAADIRQADAEEKLGRASRVPSVALGASYGREEQATIVQVVLGVRLPLFDHGQGTTAIAKARRARVQTEMSGTRRRAAVEVATAVAASRQLSAAVRRFEQTGVATLERTERAATASYEAGAIPIGQLLIIQRELILAKLDYADLLLGAASARVELIASTGGWR